MELSIVKGFNAFGLGQIDFVTIFISNIPFLITLWLLLSFLAVLTDKKKGKIVFIAVMLAMVLHFAISEGLFKHLLPLFTQMRIRPYLVDASIVPLGKLFTDSSFPSSHMASTLAALSALVYFYRRYWIWALIFGLVMAFARLHNGMHFPTDVLAGSILGIIYGVSGASIAEGLFKKKV